MASLSGLMLLANVAITSAIESDIISDIVTPISDERRALEIKSYDFWNMVKEAGQQTKLDEHLEVYEDIESVIAALPAQNSHVRDLLFQALALLRSADAAVLQQSVEMSGMASERLQSASLPESMFSFLTGGQNFLALAINRCVGGSYASKVNNQVSSRQADVLPSLRGAASVSSSVLQNCRLASKLGFDVMKYDIYNSGVPKTPPNAKTAASKLVDAAGQTRHQFMQGITGIASALTKDTEEKHIAPSATVTKKLFADLEPFGTQVEHRGAGFAVAQEDKVIIDFKPFQG